MPCPPISVIVATYNRADYLRMCLASLVRQTHDGWWEVVVADDGSSDHTPQVVAEAAAEMGKDRLRHHWHPHDRFRRAFTLNEAYREGVRGEIVLFMDSDCIAAPDLLSVYAEHGQKGGLFLGGVCGLGEDFSRRLLQAGPDADKGAMLAEARRKENLAPGAARKCRNRYWKSRFYCALGVGKPKIRGSNFAATAAAFEDVNGFDQGFVGYGQEDSDLRDRLKARGWRIVCLHTLALAYHLWHPTDLHARKEAFDGKNNRAYYNRPEVPTVCRDGLRTL